MPWIVQNLWLIPALPLAAAAAIAVTKRPHRRFAATMTIGTMAFSFLLSLCAFAHTLGHGAAGEIPRQVFNFDWFQTGSGTVQLGWVLDPLTAIMLVMVTLVSLLIFIYSTGYMAHDDNFTRFFCFLSLFAAAMLGVVIANSLLLLFICWELVGLSSYLLIGFWYQKPSAAAAAKKAFITTRIGDVVFFLGMLWLYSRAGTLLFYNNGNGCLESSALSKMIGLTTTGGMMVTTGIGLLIFCGAVGKSGQVPLHVWLPDAMEGPTPVSALIHAATMVAAGVFLIARVYPILDPAVAGVTGGSTAALTVVAWVGAITAVFAACIAVAQTDIKRILAYSTVSQLGFMMLGLGVGGVAVGMFHLITHAFFKALLFLGAGSVIHGCHEEQDIRKMGGLRKYMPVTFAAYAVGMMALSGVPIFFSGFWSKDEILHAAHGWPVSKVPFYLGVFGALLTAFYMTRQMFYVFAGTNRAGLHGHAGHSESGEGHGHAQEPHESPAVMTLPLVILAVFAVVLGFIGTPVWPWFQNYLTGENEASGLGELFRPDILFTLSLSTAVVAVGLWLGWRFYGRTPIQKPEEPDILERPEHPVAQDIFTWLKHKLYVDELYEATIIRFNAWWAQVCNGLDLWFWNGLVLLVSYLVVGLSWVNRIFDEFVINLGFDAGCGGVGLGGRLLARLQDGRVQDYLRVIGVALAALALLLLWGCGGS